MTEIAGILLVGITCRPPSLLANTLHCPAKQFYRHSLDSQLCLEMAYFQKALFYIFRYTDRQIAIHPNFHQSFLKTEKNIFLRLAGSTYYIQSRLIICHFLSHAVDLVKL